MLCAFRAQTILIRQMLACEESGQRDGRANLRFPGVRTQSSHRGADASRQPIANRDEDDDSAPPIGYSGARRFNVAVTRAKALCVVVGHRKLASGRAALARLARLRRPRRYRGAKLDEDGDDAQDDDVAADLTDMIASKNLPRWRRHGRPYRRDRALQALHACETA